MALHMDAAHAEAAQALPLDLDSALVAATCATRMIAECEHEGVFAGPPGRLLLAQGANEAQPQPVRDAALQLVKRLRRLATQTVSDSTRFYVLQLGVASQVAAAQGTARCAALTDAFLQAGAPLPAAGTVERRRLAIGLFEALRAHVMDAVQCKAPLYLDALLPWASGAGCVLSAVAARTLANELATKCNLTVICANYAGLMEPWRAPARALVNALQVHGSAMQRADSFRARLMRKARQRLLLHRKELKKTPIPTGWLSKTNGAPSQTGAQATPSAPSGLPSQGSSRGEVRRGGSRQKKQSRSRPSVVGHGRGRDASLPGVGASAPAKDAKPPLVALGVATATRVTSEEAQREAPRMVEAQQEDHSTDAQKQQNVQQQQQQQQRHKQKQQPQTQKQQLAAAIPSRPALRRTGGSRVAPGSPPKQQEADHKGEDVDGEPSRAKNSRKKKAEHLDAPLPDGFHKKRKAGPATPTVTAAGAAQTHSVASKVLGGRGRHHAVAAVCSATAAAPASAGSARVAAVSVPSSPAPAREWRLRASVQ